jgi:predicted RNase H-like nuclease (RuvC/YqgF family)
LEQCRSKNASAEANAVDLQEFIDAQAAELRTLEALRRENASLAQKVDTLESENKQLARQLNEARQDVVAAAGAGKQLLLQVEQLKQQLAALQ